MSKKKKPFSFPDRKIRCGTCGHTERVAWEDPQRYLDSCPKCDNIKANHPEIYKWVMDVIQEKTISENRAQDMIDSSLRPSDIYY